MKARPMAGGGNNTGCLPLSGTCGRMMKPWSLVCEANLQRPKSQTRDPKVTESLP